VVPLFVHATSAEIRARSAAQDKGRTTAVAILPFDIARGERVQGNEVDMRAATRPDAGACGIGAWNWAACSLPT
jgi:hypothetical protein